ncbi:hypothetical protein BC567DRAFT_78030 [Phyllosticta citribraziliensis]
MMFLVLLHTQSSCNTALCGWRWERIEALGHHERQLDDRMKTPNLNVSRTLTRRKAVGQCRVEALYEKDVRNH